MRAVVLHRYGSPDALRLEEVERPEPGRGQVLVEVRATTINDYDWCYLRGKPYAYRLGFGLTAPRVRILGAEIAGTVVACGEQAQRFAPGDEVYGDISEAGFGGFAEYAAVNEDALARKPAAIGFEEAAALPHAAMLALQGLVDVGRIAQGERVLINGAGGGVGTLGVQLARLKDAGEITGVDHGDKLERLRGLGFHELLDYTEVDFTRTGRRYDLIIDTKTNRPTSHYLRALQQGGRYVTVGGELPRLLELLAKKPLVAATTTKRVSIVALKPNANLSYLNELMAERRLDVVIDGPYPLERVPEAMRRFGEANHVGKIVITV
jgi:NADPH:quinone reductase-like Zn-dependent oxidoreductase